MEKNVGFGLRMRGVPAAEIAPRVGHALKLVQLTGQAHKLPGQLSGGQQQRVAIARAIVIEPPLILMDEPLSNLDAKLRIETRAEIRRIHRELDRATIYVTHDQDEALSLADRIVVMKDGVVQQIGTPPEVYAQPANLHVARFMGYRNVLELDVVRAGRRARRRRRARHRARPACASSRWPERAPRSRSGRRRSSSPTARGENTIAGRVDNVEYCGRDALLDVVTASGTLLHVRGAVHDPARRPGARARARRTRARVSGRLSESR